MTKKELLNTLEEYLKNNLLVY